MPKKLTTEQFIKKAKFIHGDKYDYSKVEYLSSHSKVKILCQIHKEFLQSPAHHTNGRGCPKCKNEKIGNLSRSNNKTFIKKAKNVHGDKYDYSLIKYINSGTKVIIICKIHNSFTQIPDNHLAGRGCPKCKIDKISGSNNYNWNSKLTDNERVHRDYNHKKEINKWRKIVYKRDNYTCQKCFQKGGKLEAHHILAWSKFSEVRFDINNGITLCEKCHDSYHSIYILDNCNRKTLAEFLSMPSEKEMLEMVKESPLYNPESWLFN